MLVTANMQGAIYAVAPLIDQKQAVDIFTRPVSHHSLKTTAIVTIKLSQKIFFLRNSLQTVF